MKVLVLSDCFFPVIGGREYVIHNLMSEFVKKCDCLLGVPKMKIENKFPDETLPYNVVRCKSICFTKNECLAIADKSFKKQIMEFKPDVIHCHTKYGLSNYALKLAKKLNIPVVTTVHTYYKVIYPKTIKVKLISNMAIKRVVRVLNKYTAVTTVSDFMVDYLKSIGAKGNVVTIRNGTEIKMPDNRQELIDHVNKTYNLSADENVFSMVGRMLYIKNVDFLLRSALILKQKGYSFKLILVGDGANLEDFKKLATELGLEQNVIFTGRVSDRDLIKGIYLRSLAFSFPSISETSGLVIQEAAALNVPSIVIEKTAPAEVIVNQSNGLVTPLDENKFMQAMAYALENRNVMQTLGEKARGEIALDWNEISNQYLDFYKKLIDDKKSQDKK